MNKNKKIVIYGAGSAGKHLLKIFNSLNIDVIKGDYVDIHKSNNLIHDLNNFTNFEFIDTCNYCELMIGAKEVEATIQIKRS